jgi:ABC-type uncharacterized transport system ATPase subunit
MIGEGGKVMEEVVVFDQVRKTYPGFQLGPLSFTIQRGYIHGFIGANGAGTWLTKNLRYKTGDLAGREIYSGT